ncbi:hypothetical protein THAOC_05649, partial [Thalassiosira oceanica]
DPMASYRATVPPSKLIEFLENIYLEVIY